LLECLRDIDLKKILLDHPNLHIKCLNIDYAAKTFNILIISNNRILRIQKITFTDRYLTKFLNTSVKSSFSYNANIYIDIILHF